MAFPLVLYAWGKKKTLKVPSLSVKAENEPREHNPTFTVNPNFTVR